MQKSIILAVLTFSVFLPSAKADMSSLFSRFVRPKPPTACPIAYSAVDVKAKMRTGESIENLNVAINTEIMLTAKETMSFLLIKTSDGAVQGQVVKIDAGLALLDTVHGPVTLNLNVPNSFLIRTESVAAHEARLRTEAQKLSAQGQQILRRASSFIGSPTQVMVMQLFNVTKRTNYTYGHIMQIGIDAVRSNDGTITEFLAVRMRVDRASSTQLKDGDEGIARSDNRAKDGKVVIDGRVSSDQISLSLANGAIVTIAEIPPELEELKNTVKSPSRSETQP